MWRFQSFIRTECRFEGLTASRRARRAGLNTEGASRCADHSKVSGTDAILEPQPSFQENPTGSQVRRDTGRLSGLAAG